MAAPVHIVNRDLVGTEKDAPRIGLDFQRVIVPGSLQRYLPGVMQILMRGTAGLGSQAGAPTQEHSPHTQR